MNEDKELLLEIAQQLDRWAIETYTGSWSTHQVRPMRDLSLQIFVHLERSSTRQSSEEVEG